MTIDIQRAVCGAYQENAYILRAVGRDDCVVVDPGDDLAQIERAVGGAKPGAILLTHGHFDHTLAAQPLAEKTGAPVYIHLDDIQMLNDPRLCSYDSGVCRLPAPKGLAARPLGDRLSVCGIDFEILHTPGHSKGSVCLVLPGEGVLFSGDTLFRAGYGRMDLYGGSPEEMVRSLRRLFELPAETRVYPGHGEATTIGAERARYRL